MLSQLGTAAHRMRSRAQRSPRAVHPGEAVFVCGAAGVGKTALVRAAARTDRNGIAYVPQARTCARASIGIAAAVASRGDNRRRSVAPLLRMGARARADLIARRLRGQALRAVVFDHVDYPCPHIPHLLDYWRDRASIVVVARWEATLDCAWHCVRGGARIELRSLAAADACDLIRRWTDALSLPPREDADVETLVQLAHGNPRLIVTTLRLAARLPRSNPPIPQLVQRARLVIAAREPGAALRARRRALVAVRYSTSRKFQ